MFNIFRKHVTNPPAYDLTVKNKEKLDKQRRVYAIDEINRQIKLAIKYGKFKVYVCSMLYRSSTMAYDISGREMFEVLKYFKSLGFKITVKNSFDNYTNDYTNRNSREFYIDWSK